MSPGQTPAKPCPILKNTRLWVQCPSFLSLNIHILTFVLVHCYLSAGSFFFFALAALFQAIRHIVPATH